MNSELREKVKNIRKLEHQAKQLLRKMDKIETDWNNLKNEIIETGHEMPNTLGDVLACWHKKDL